MPIAFQSPLRNSRLWRWLPALCLACGLALAQPVNEDEMKGIYIYKFLKFIEWPPSAFAAGDDSFRVCVAGEEHVKALADTLDRQPLKDRKIALVNLAKKGQISSCQVVFISSGESWRYKSILSEIGNHPTLTISDIPDFARQGGMIEFLFEGDKLSFSINQFEAKRVDIYINSQLLALAKNVIK